MSSQQISQILSFVVARFERLQNKYSSASSSGKNYPIGSNQQSQRQARCVTVPKTEIAENSTAVDWWARLYRGLVIDPSARHYRQMGQAVWLFLYFLLNANWKTGRLYRRLSTITADTGINIFAIRRWLRVLQRNGYINACYNGRFWVIAVNKWKPLELLLTRKRKSGGQSFSSKSVKYPYSTRKS